MSGAVDGFFKKVKGVICILVGLVILLFFGVSEIITNNSPGHDIYELNANEITYGMHITGNIDFIYDYYAMESQESKTLGITTSTTDDTARWYIFPVYGEDENDTKLLTLKAGRKDYYAIDKVVDETWAYLNGESETFGSDVYSINAKAVVMEPDLYDFYYSWYGKDYKEEAEAYLVPYVLVPVADTSTIALFCLLGAGLMIYGFVSLFHKKKEAPQPQLNAAAAYNNAIPTERRQDDFKPESYTPETYDPYGGHPGEDVGNQDDKYDWYK